MIMSTHGSINRSALYIPVTVLQIYVILIKKYGPFARREDPLQGQIEST
jgi:hypothetical protein